MGGHNAGEVASQIAIDITSQFLIAGIHIEAKSEDAFTTAGPLKVLMEKSIQQANRKIVEASGDDDKKSGMGTTIACLLFCGSWFVVGNIGDSRCYRFRDGKISQLSVDHSWIQGMVKQGAIKQEDAKHHPQRALLLQALGNREVEPSFTSGCPQPGDVFVVCSDGLTEVVSNNTIGFVLSQDGSPQKTQKNSLNWQMKMADQTIFLSSWPKFYLPSHLTQLRRRVTPMLKAIICYTDLK